MRATVLLALAGCQWIDDDNGRLDRDEDGIHVREDCNDQNPEYAHLEPFHGELACGDRLEGDNHQGFDAMQVVNCLHPYEEEDLTRLGYKELAYGFVSDVPVDVVVTLHASEMLVDDLPYDNGGVSLIAIRGPRCTLDACQVGLPIVPEGWHRGEAGTPVSIEEREEGWEPQVFFHADPGERWFVVVSGGQEASDGEVSPFALDVDCPAGN